MRGRQLAIFGAASLALCLGVPALAADVPVITKAPAMAEPPPPLWDVSFGGLITTDYYFRGISQSNHGPSAGAYIEGLYNGPYGQWYLGLAGYSINWPTTFAGGTIPGFSDPAAEIDFYGGWRHEWGNYSADIGVIYYYYPKEQFGIDSDFWEVYWKGGYAVSDKANVGLNVYYTPDILNYGDAFFAPAGISAKARGIYASVTADYTYWEQNDWSAAISGELGHWWIKDTGYVHPAMGLTDPSYTYWNAGLSFAYKAVTLDLRYHGTDLGKTGCGSFLLFAPPHPSNSWCDDRFIATLSFDASLSDLK